MTHVETSPYHPQSNGEIERFDRTVKHDAIRKQTPPTRDDALGVVGDFVEHCNIVRLHSALGYVTPRGFLDGRRKAILAERGRDRKHEAAREKRRLIRQAVPLLPPTTKAKTTPEASNTA